MHWDNIWQKKGLENTTDLIKLSGFNLHYDNNNISNNHVKMIINDCDIKKKR